MEEEGKKRKGVRDGVGLGDRDRSTATKCQQIANIMSNYFAAQAE